MSVVYAEVLAALHSKAGLRIMVSCGGFEALGLSSPPLPPGSCQANVFPLSDPLQRWAAGCSENALGLREIMGIVVHVP